MDLSVAKKKKKEKAPKPEADSSEEKSGKGGLIGAILTPLVLGGVSFGMVYSLPSAEAPAVSRIYERNYYGELSLLWGKRMCLVSLSLTFSFDNGKYLCPLV